MNTSFNRLLLNQDRELLKPYIDLMWKHVPEMMATKIPTANVQQAFVLQTMKHLTFVNDKALCVGSFMDTASATLKKTCQFSIHEIDPDPRVNGIDLHTFWTRYSKQFDKVFSTSVIEHVYNDEQFLEEVCLSLKDKGFGILTMDFKDDWKPGDRVPTTSHRFYRKLDLEVRLADILARNDCYLYDDPDWSGEPDFEWEGIKYCFATYVFRKG